MTARLTGGEETVLGVADEYDPVAATGVPGTFVPPTQWVRTTGNVTLEDTPDVKHSTSPSAGRDTNFGYRRGRAAVGGGFTIPLMPYNGRIFRQKAIGKTVAYAGLSADTTTSITTTGNKSTIVLSAGGAYAFGDIVHVGSSGTIEVVPVISYTSGSKTLVTAALRNTHSSSGTAVQRKAAEQEQVITTSDAVGNVLGTISLEDVIRDAESSYRYPYGYVDGHSIKAADSGVTVDLNILNCARRVLADGVGSNPSASTFDATLDGTWDDVPYEFIESYLVYPDDPTDSGTLTMQTAIDGFDWGIDLKNNFTEVVDSVSPAKRYRPGARDVMVNFKKYNEAGRFVMWEGLLNQGISFPWMAFLRKNTGTLAAPIWAALCIACPVVTLGTAKEIRGLTDTIGEDITGEAQAVGASPKMFVTAYLP